MNIRFFSMRSLAYFMGFGLFLVLANGCGPSDETMPQKHQEDKGKHDGGFLRLAKACADGQCDQDALEAAYDKLDDAAIKALADEKDGDLNVSHMLVKAKLEPKVVAVLGKFLNKLESLEKAKVDEQLDHKVGGEDAMAVVRGAHRPSGEDAGERAQVLAYFVSLRPTKTNDLKDSSNAFDAAAFKDVMAKVDDANVKAVAEGLSNPNREAMLAWAVATTADGQPLFNKIYDKMDPATQQPVLRHGLYDAALAAGPDDVYAMWTGIDAGDWRLVGVANEFWAHIADKYFANANKEDFKALYALIPSPARDADKKALRTALWDAAYAAALGDAAANPPIPAKANALRNLGGELDAPNWDLAAHLNELLTYITKKSYAGNNPTGFKELYIANGVGDDEKRAMRKTLVDEAYAAQAANPNSLVNLVSALGNGANKWDLDASKIVMLKYLGAKFAQAFETAADKPPIQAKFRTLYAAGGAMDQAAKNALHDGLIARAYGTPAANAADVSLALARVGALVTADFFTAEELIEVEFNPFGKADYKVRLLYAVIDQAQKVGQVDIPLSQNLVRALSAPMKDKIIGAQWQSYLRSKNNVVAGVGDKAIDLDLVGPKTGAPGDANAKRKAARNWLDY